MDYCATVKRNVQFVHKTTWMALKGIMLSEKKPTLKGHILRDSIYITFLKCKSINSGKRLVADRD